MMEYSNSLKNKNIIVTGANAGIGYEAALDFAKRGARLILGCRNQEKANEACEKIKAESKNDNVEVELLDLSSLKSTREFGNRILQKWNTLDILVNNGGLASVEHKNTEEGFETIWVTNYLGHYLLTRMLLDLLKKSAPSRIINVSSAAHNMTKINWDDINYEKSQPPMFATYGQSKLAQILMTVELAKKLEGTNVSVVALHPGVVATDIWRNRENQSLFSRISLVIMRPFIRLFAKGSSDGASTTIHCATSDDIPSQTGLYFVDSKVTATSQAAMDKESAERLWKLSAEMVGLED